MHRFYLPSIDFKKDILMIEDRRIVYQSSKVLRMWKEDFFQVFDGKKEYLMQVQDINKRKLIAKRVKEIKNNAEPNQKVSLYQAIPKKPALFELVVQKATEIGVDQIFPLITEHTEKRRMARFERLSTIAMEAAEQCGRMKIPTIRHPVNFEEVVGEMKNGYIAYEYEGTKYLSDYADELKKVEELSLVIGPEGGLSESEISLAREAGLRPFTFGPRILRTETAAIAALALIMLNK